MISSAHLLLTCTKAVAQGRWAEAFPDGEAVDDLRLERMLRSPTLAHTIVWVDARTPAWERLARAMLDLQPALRIVLTSGAPNAAEGLRAMLAGCRGYVHAHAVAPLYREVALVVSHGGLWLGPELMRQVAAATHAALSGRAPTSIDDSVPLDTTEAQDPPTTEIRSTLTLREQQIAEAVARGLSNKEIAAQMQISLKTVKAHLGSVFGKLEVRDRLQLALKLAGRVRKDAQPNAQTTDMHQRAFA